jgi:hypothetical protein
MICCNWLITSQNIKQLARRKKWSTMPTAWALTDFDGMIANLDDGITYRAPKQKNETEPETRPVSPSLWGSLIISQLGRDAQDGIAYVLIAAPQLSSLTT